MPIAFQSPSPAEPTPRHVAIIMDGNGRWAQSRGLPRTAGHEKGAEAVRETVRHARRIGLECLTLFAFSTLNWQRPTSEVRDLMDLLERFLVDELPEMLANGIRLVAIGERELLPAKVRKRLEDTEARTAHGRDMTLVLAVSYDGRRDLVRAARQIAEMARRGELLPADVDEAQLASVLSTADLPDVDLLVRTSGEKRLSGFLPFEACYAELHFTPTHWPDFGAEALDAALAEFAHRHRRFGMTGEQAAALG
jgi:undecaprenyl diphosphate synthase